jgi:hypothetical protein
MLITEQEYRRKVKEEENALRICEAQGKIDSAFNASDLPFKS